MSSEELVELGPQYVGVDDDGVVAVDVEDSDLQQCSVGGRSDEHDQVVVQVYASHCVSDRVPYVRVRDVVLSRWRTDPHLGNIACLDDMPRPGYGGPHGPSCMPPYHGARSRLLELVDRALVQERFSSLAAMGPALPIGLMAVIIALIAVPSWKLGKRLGTPPAQRNATPEEQAERKKQRAARRREELAALTTRERALFYAYYAFSIPAIPVGVLLMVYGHHATRTVGVVLLGVAVLLMTVPVGPVLGGRARRRKRASSAQ